jgi:hypothetical protein
MPVMAIVWLRLDFSVAKRNYQRVRNAKSAELTLTKTMWKFRSDMVVMG